MEQRLPKFNIDHKEVAQKTAQMLKEMLSTVTDEFKEESDKPFMLIKESEVNLDKYIKFVTQHKCTKGCGKFPIALLFGFIVENQLSHSGQYVHRVYVKCNLCDAICDISKKALSN